MNNHVYPNIHYPEVYILEGGYCQYFKHSSARCQPPSYVPMDDPRFVVSRNEDMDQFRKAKFGRYKSYTYGDGPFKAFSSQQLPQVKRNSAPTAAGPVPLFAAANAARTRRGGGLSSLPEDGNLTAHSDNEETDIGDSPCPPPTKNNALKAKKLGRGSLTRADTYGPIRMAY
jgi:M-phase inducer tyrosine phosphatase